MNSSLQDRFEEFQKKRQQNYLYRKYVNKSDIDRSQIEFQIQLRKKFVDQAKKYLGVPYHSKFHDENSPHFNAPLYLDCSGLIRQIIFDLREDFGFTLGKWNQAYQFDILEEPIKKEEMEIGDLIFYAGTYYSKNERVFQHNIVHVEIYLGEGEKSIAARYPNETVSIFNSYKFESKRYYDVVYYYKSIKPWLMGIKQSYCAEHPWRDDRNLWIGDKYSIFAKQEEDKQQIEIEGKRKVYIGQGNNAELIKNYFRNKENYILMDTLNDAFKNDYFFKWVQCPQSINYFEFRSDKQMINHIPKASHNLGFKIPLLNLLRDAQLTHMIPKTYRMDQIVEVIEFLKDNEEGLWILKPYNLNCGRGILIISDIKQFKHDLNVKKQFQIGDYYKIFIEEERQKLKQELLDHMNQQDIITTDKSQELKYDDINPLSIIQKYIEKPILLNNRKFDIRCYCLIASVNPYKVFFHEGYARLSIFDYTLDQVEDEQQRVVHLTNAAIQKQHPAYKERKEQSIWSMNDWEKYLLQFYSKEILDKCRNQMKEYCQLIFKAAQGEIQKQGQYGEFELFGMDFLLEEMINEGQSDIRVYLLEANINPALFTDNPTLKQIIPPILNQTLDIVLSIRDNQNYDIGNFQQLL